MFRKKMLNNWGLFHLLDCEWYFDFPKDSIAPFHVEQALRKKYNDGDLE
jgi:hypothetical protein